MKLKPFNLEEAKAGKPVCTRDGKPVRIVCFDYKEINYSLVGLISYGDEESVSTFTEDGRWRFDQSLPHANDLFMAPVKHEGWINIYPNGNCSSTIYSTEEEAKSYASDAAIATTKIEWED